MRRGIFDNFSNGTLRALIGCEVFTTGYDEPSIDLIAIMRATKSTALYVQMLGRGCRRAEGKVDCKVLDFGENIARHGKLDEIRIARRYNPVSETMEADVETIVAKECPSCGAILRYGDTECADCGFVYPVAIRHGPEASNDSVMSEPEQPHIVDVVATRYARHVPKDKPTPSLRVDYVLSMIADYPVKKVSEWVCFEHRGVARDKASRWWLGRGIGHSPVPLAVEDALARLTEIRNPRKIEIQKDGKWWRVLRVVEWSDESGGEEQKRLEEETEQFYEETGFNL
jgi:DNA repair protein RadD